MTNNCLFYDNILQKTIPCLLVANQIYTINYTISSEFMNEKSITMHVMSDPMTPESDPETDPS